jgi:hypothetical protein
MMLMLALLLVMTDADSALRKLETQSAESIGKRSQSIAALEKALKLPRCPPCRRCSVEERFEIEPVSCPASTPVAEELRKRMPAWFWIVGAGVVGLATGAAIVGIGVAAGVR